MPKKTKRINRVDMHKRICYLSGVNTKSVTGYATRKELMELMVYLERVNSALKSVVSQGIPQVTEILQQGNLISWNESSKA